jgi:hypothetical protein
MTSKQKWVLFYLCWLVYVASWHAYLLSSQWLLLVLVTTGMTVSTLYCSLRTNMCAAVIYVACIYRIFAGPLWFDLVVGNESSFDVQISSFKDSPRGDYVERWLNKTNLPYAVTDMAEANNTIECSNDCPCHDVHSKGGMYTSRIKLLLSTYASTSHWLLLLEDDAMYLGDFEAKLRTLLPTLYKYDYVSLDVRSFAGFGLAFGKMCCAVGALIKVSSMKNIASMLRVVPEQNCYVRWDSLIGHICGMKEFQCLAVPYLGENNMKSTMDSA